MHKSSHDELIPPCFLPATSRGSRTHINVFTSHLGTQASHVDCSAALSGESHCLERACCCGGVPRTQKYPPPPPPPPPPPRPSRPSSAENPSLPIECPRVRDSSTVRCLYSVLVALAWAWPGCASTLTPAAKKPRDALAWCHAMYTFTGIRLSPALISCLNSMSTIPPPTHPQQWRLMNPPKTACGCLSDGTIVNGHTRSPLRAQELCESRGLRP